MKVEQFYDKALAHASYAILSDGKVALVDPGRDPQPYYDFAKKYNAQIQFVIETHPHADFVSSHLEIHQQTGAVILVSEKVGADYPHQGFDEGDVVELGDVLLKALNTPGHSPDSISILLEDKEGRQEALFSGDTLFVGDVGRPDLREGVGNMRAERESLARDMFRTVQQKLKPLNDSILVYPAHGAGSLCGKSLSSDTHSTISREKSNNWAFSVQNEDEFVQELLNDQPFIPKYFGYDVDLNREGAEAYQKAVSGVPVVEEGAHAIPEGSLIIDTRHESKFKKGHLPGSINLMIQEGNKFETWLGSIIAPGEHFYLVTESSQQSEQAISRAAKIGYEKQLSGVAVANGLLPNTSPHLDLDDFMDHPEKYTILDIRNENEVRKHQLFDRVETIPLHELRERVAEIPTDKPIVVHCAGGYRSAAGASILERKIQGQQIFDLSENVKKFG